MYATRSFSDGCSSVAGISQSRNAPLNTVRSFGGSFASRAGTYRTRRSAVVADVGEEPLAEPRARAQRHHEPHARLVDLAHRLGLSHRGVTHDQQPRTRDLKQPLQARADQRQFRRVPRIGTAVEHRPIRRARLQRADLPSHPTIRRPPLADQRRMLIRTTDPDRGQIDMQPAGSDTEPLDRTRRDPRAEILGVEGEGLQRPAETIIVQQRRRDPQQLMHRGTGRPARDVIQRRGRAQRLATSAHTTSPTDSTDRALRGSAPSTVSPPRARAGNARPATTAPPTAACRPSADPTARTNPRAPPAAPSPSAHPSDQGLPQRDGGPCRSHPDTRPPAASTCTRGQTA